MPDVDDKALASATADDRPFQRVCHNLKRFTVSLDRYLQAPSDDTLWDESWSERPDGLIPSSEFLPKEYPPVDEHRSGANEDDGSAPPRIKAIIQLHQACERIFGNTDPLRFEYLEENGNNSRSS